MKRTAAMSSTANSANLALALVVVGWLLVTLGAFRQLGDPNPLIPPAELETTRDVSLTIMFAGVAALVASIWLSGLSFRLARIRAGVALMLFAVPLLTLFVFAYLARG